MTSKNLFHDILKEDRKRRLWSLALSILANFFALPVFAALCMSIYDQRLIDGLTTLPEVREAFAATVASAGNIPVLLIAGGLALINGLNGMAYLHSRTKTDLYFGLPVKRETIFNAAFVNGILFFVIPYLIFMVITAVFGYARGYFLLGSLPQALFGILYVLIMYISMYALVVLSAVICGNTVVSIFMSVIVMFYVPLCYLTVMGYSSTFFVNYYHRDNDFWRFLSPALSYFWITMQKMNVFIGEKNPDLIPMAVSSMAVMAVLALAVYFLSLLLVKKRPAEAASKAIAFRGLKPVIKILLMIIGTMLFALLMAEVSSGDRFGWIVFGFIAGVLLIQAICEIVFEFDFKACIRHPVSFVIGAVVTAAVMAVFMFDLAGYDSYIPSEASVNTSAVCCYNLQTSIEYSKMEDGYRTYVNADEYRLDHMFLTDNEDVIKLAREGVAFSNMVHSNQMNFINKGNSAGEMTSQDDVDRASFVIGFRQKNGHTVYRSYYIDLRDEELMNALGNIMETKEYKEGVFVSLEAKPEDMVQMFATTGLGYQRLSVTDEEKEHFLDSYRLDLMGQDFESMKNEEPVCMVTATDSAKKSWMYEGNETKFFIYPSYSRCMKILEDMDVRLEPDYSKITSLSVSHYEGDDWFSADFTERDRIDEIMSLCTPGTFYYFNSALHADKNRDNESLDVSVYCDDIDYSDSFVFGDVKIPEYVTGSMTKSE